MAREPNHDAASSSQVWQKDAMDKSTRRLVAAEKDQELLNVHENLKSTVLAQNGHTISIYPLLAFHILRKFSRMCDRDTVANLEKNGRS